MPETFRNPFIVVVDGLHVSCTGRIRFLFGCFGLCRKGSADMTACAGVSPPPDGAAATCLLATSPWGAAEAAAAACCDARSIAACRKPGRRCLGLTLSAS